MHTDVLRKDRRSVKLPDSRRVKIHAEEIAYRRKLAEQTKLSKFDRLRHRIFRQYDSNIEPVEYPLPFDDSIGARTAADLLKIQVYLLRRLPAEIVTVIIDHILVNQLLIYTVDLRHKITSIRYGEEASEVHKQPKVKPDEIARLHWLGSESFSTLVRVPPMSIASLTSGTNRPLFSSYATPYFSDPDTIEFEIDGETYRGPRVGPCVSSIIMEVDAIYSPNIEHKPDAKQDLLRTSEGWVEVGIKFEGGGRAGHLIDKAEALIDPAGTNGIYKGAYVQRSNKTTLTPAYVGNTPAEALKAGPDWRSREPLGCWKSDNERGMLRASCVIDQHDQTLGTLIALLREDDWFHLSVKIENPRLLEVLDCKVHFLTTYRSLLHHMPETWLYDRG